MSTTTYAVTKRALDVVLSATALVALLPLGIIVAAAVKIAEPTAPILFTQPRAGREGQPFTIYKFRSMRVASGSGHGAGPNIDTGTWSSGVPETFTYKSPQNNLALITPIGRLLRRTSIDEMPQLINVLKGDMSLVGPRPEILPIAAHYNAHQARRLTVRPGLTGLAQVTGRAEQDHATKIAADLRYVDIASLRTDLSILAKTVSVVLGTKGSY